MSLFNNRDSIYEEMEGLKFKVGPKSFYQTNTDQAYNLYKEIGLTEKCEELANRIYGDLEGMSVKEAYEKLLEVADTYKQDEQFSMIENMYLKQQFIDAEIGDILYFGNYEQDNDLQNGKESIAWIVLEKTEEKITLLSKNMIERQ